MRLRFSQWRAERRGRAGECSMQERQVSSRACAIVAAGAVAFLIYYRLASQAQETSPLGSCKVASVKVASHTVRRDSHVIRSGLGTVTLSLTSDPQSVSLSV
jgi:hypothetical protein